MSAMTDDKDEYARYGYSSARIGFGKRPAIIVVDLQNAFVDPQYSTGGRPLIVNAVKATAKLLAAARPYGIPIFQCATAYDKTKLDLPHWKVAICRELTIGTHGAQVVEELQDPSYIFFSKCAPSIFFNTPLSTGLVRHGTDTVIVTGANTSGCIRASVIDSFSYGFRTIVPVECVGDLEEGPHWANLKDVDRRYADVVSLNEVLEYLTTLPRDGGR
jgi:maleamate amidohydrolase